MKVSKVLGVGLAVLLFSVGAYADIITAYVDGDYYQRVVALWNGYDHSLRIGNPSDHYDSSPERMLLKFDLSSIPQNAQITSATLYLDNYNPWTTTPIPTAIHRITENWSYGVKWSTQPDYDSTPAAVETWYFSWSHYEGSWDITSLVQGWVDGTYPNYGVTIRHNSEEEGDGDDVYGPPWVGWWNVYGPSNADYQPKIEIEYSVIPEPATIGLILVGLASLIKRKK